MPSAAFRIRRYFPESGAPMGLARAVAWPPKPPRWGATPYGAGTDAPLPVRAPRRRRLYLSRPLTSPRSGTPSLDLGQLGASVLDDLHGGGEAVLQVAEAQIPEDSPSLALEEPGHLL